MGGARRQAKKWRRSGEEHTPAKDRPDKNDGRGGEIPYTYRNAAAMGGMCNNRFGGDSLGSQDTPKRDPMGDDTDRTKQAARAEEVERRRGMGQVKSTLVHWHEHHVDAGFDCQRRHQQRFGEESRSRRKGKGEVEGKKVAENGGKGDGEPSTRRKREKRGFNHKERPCSAREQYKRQER